MVTRRVPRWSELREVLQPKPFLWSGTERRLRAAATVADLRRLARRRVPRAVFDYTDGAAETESSLRRAREAFAAVEFRPRVLRDVSTVDPGTTILGAPARLPLVLAPTGFTRMMHHEGEPAVARAAVDAGLPYALSTLGTTSVEDLATAVPGGDRWFQLYVWKDRGATAELVDRAAVAGYRALILTVDSPVGGFRVRDVHNGLTVPPTLALRTFADGALHPRWWLNLLSTEPLRFATFSRWEGTVAELMNTTLDPTMTLDGLRWLRDRWSGPLVVKGVQTLEDARAVVDSGADAVVLSNHGGRQLDRAPVPLELLPPVVEAIGERAEVYLDGGVMGGADVVAAVALGARACLVGRAYLYGLMAGGERGVRHTLELFDRDIRRTLQLLGVNSPGALTPDHVRLRR